MESANPPDPTSIDVQPAASKKRSGLAAFLGDSPPSPKAEVPKGVRKLRKSFDSYDKELQEDEKLMQML